MFKKIAFSLMAAVSMLSFIGSVHAREVISVIYSWGAADPAANFDRAIIEQANKMQDRYRFIFEPRPGAGGSVAAAAALSNTNSVLATSSAFFIRPNLFPEGSHDVNGFQQIMPKCVVTALITSQKYRSWDDVPKNQHLTIGVSGLGTTTHLIAEQIRKKYPQLTVVPFKSTSESLVSLLNGSVDFSVNFIGDVEQWVSQGRVNILGVTGNNTFKSYPTLISQGFDKNLQHMSPPHQYVTSTQMSLEKFKEIRKILVRAAATKEVQDAYGIDHCISISDMQDAEIQRWYQQQIQLWKSLTANVKLD